MIRLSPDALDVERIARPARGVGRPAWGGRAPERGWPAPFL